MVIDIIGAGAIGLLFATKLKASGHHIRVWCNTSDQATMLKEQGMMFQSLEESPTIVFFDEVYCLYELANVATSPIPSLCTILAIKQTGIDQRFLDQMALFTEKISSATMVCIQNGIGHIEKIKHRVKSVAVVAAVTSEAARRDGNMIQHTGQGETAIAFQLEIEDKLKLITKSINNAGIRCFVSNSIEQAIYNKLIVNAVINPLTALFRVPNGVLPQHAARLSLMKLLYEESKMIVEQACSITLSITFDDIIRVCEKTASNYSSMFADILHHRVTEIEAINGALVQIADSHDLSASVNKTIYLLVIAQHP